MSRAFESLSIAVSADSHSYLLFRMGKFRGENFVGLLGTWLWLPVPATSLAVCDGAGGGAPHELFLALCLVALVLWQVAPRFMWKHAACSPARFVQQGRVHTMLTANVSHLTRSTSYTTRCSCSTLGRSCARRSAASDS